MTTSPTPPVIPPDEHGYESGEQAEESSAEADRRASYGEEPEQTQEDVEDSMSSADADREASEQEG